MAKITIPIQFDEDKLKEIVEEAVNRLKAEGYIWRDNPPVLPDTPSQYDGGNKLHG